MTSRNLFFKLMKENTKQRLWTVSLIFVIFFFIFPVQTALNITTDLDAGRYAHAVDPVLALTQAQGNLSRHFQEWCSIENGMLIFVLLLFSLVCGVSGFAYLHSKKQTDFYHGLPLRRELLFAVQYINGVLYVAVPYLLCMLISAVMLSVKGIEVSWGGMFLGYLTHLSFYLLNYSTVIAAVVLTGNLIVGLMGAFLFFAWGPLVSGLLLGYCETYFETYVYNEHLFWDWCCRLSPAAWYIKAAASEGAGIMAVKGLVSAAVISGLGVFLYQKRPSEAAGKAMAFSVSQPVVKLLVVVPSALSGSLLFQSMMNRDGWSVFGLVCGLLLSCCVIEIIYHFDFRRLFANKRELVLCGILSVVVFAFFRFDLSGHDRYLPSEGKLESAGLYCHVIDGDAMGKYLVEPDLVVRDNGSYSYVHWMHKSGDETAEEMRLEDTAPVLEIARQGIEDAVLSKEARFSKGRYADNTWQEDKFIRTVIIAYHLTGGKTVLRSYDLDLREVRDSLDAVYHQKGYKETIYPVLSLQPEEIAGVNYREQNDCSHVTLEDEEMKARLLTAYQKELSALTMETRREESPVAELQFKTLGMQEIIDVLRASEGNYTEFNHYLYFPVYPSFTETIQLLEECGTEVGSILTSETTEKIVLQYQGVHPQNLEMKDKNGEELLMPETVEGSAGEYVWKQWSENEIRYGNPNVVITDKEEIQQILDATVSDELGADNRFNEEYIGIRVIAYVPLSGEKEGNSASKDANLTEAKYVYGEYVQEYDDSYECYRLTFDLDKIPDFIRAEFALTEELMEYDTASAY